MTQIFECRTLWGLPIGFTDKVDICAYISTKIISYCTDIHIHKHGYFSVYLQYGNQAIMRLSNDVVMSLSRKQKNVNLEFEFGN